MLGPEQVGRGLLDTRRATALSLSAFTWFLKCGSRSSFMAKFILGADLASLAKPGGLLLGRSYVLLLDACMSSPGQILWGDGPHQAGLGASVLT